MMLWAPIARHEMALQCSASGRISSATAYENALTTMIECLVRNSIEMFSQSTGDVKLVALRVCNYEKSNLCNIG